MRLFLLLSIWTSTVFASEFRLPYSHNHERVLAEAASLGAPMTAVRKAFAEAENSTYRNKDVISVFDLAQHSNRKRYYLIDLKNGRVSAYHSSHGKGNGAAGKATRFRGFNNPDNNMTPLGPLVTDDRAYEYEEYARFVDSYSGKRYEHQLVLGVEGTKPYNDEINTRGALVAMHTRGYATAGYRRANGVMGRSHGCIVLDPEVHNGVVTKVSGGSLIYVTVGNESVERYAD